MVQWVAPRAREPKTAAAPGNGTAGRRSRSRGAARAPGRRRRRQPCSEPDTLPSGSDTEDGEGAPGSPTAGVSRGRTGETAVGTRRACHSGDGPASRTERVARREGIAMRRLATALCILVVAAWSFPAAAAEQARGRQRGARPAQAERAPRRAPQRAAPARSAPPRRMSQPRGRASAGRAAAQAPPRQGAVRRAAPRTSGSSRATAPATRSAGRPSPRRAAPRAAAQAPAAGSGATGRAADVGTHARHRAGNAIGRTAERATACGGPRPGDAPPHGHPGRSRAHRSPPVVPPRPPPGGTAGAPRRCGAHPNAASGAPRRLRPVAIEP